MYHPLVNPISAPRPGAHVPALLLAFGIALAPVPRLGAQDTVRVAPGTVVLVESLPPADPRDAAQRAQSEFEKFRRLNLPEYRGRTFSGRNCPEPVGMNWCYWYDETSPLLPEPPKIVEGRDRLLRLLDSLGTQQPGDNWISGQRVRYLIEAGRPLDGLKVAEACKSFGWWCDALAGISLHEAGRYAESEARFEQVLAAMGPRERCTWKDLTPYLDDDTRRQYIRNACGTPEREAFAAR